MAQDAGMDGRQALLAQGRRCRDLLPSLWQMGKKLRGAGDSNKQLMILARECNESVPFFSSFFPSFFSPIPPLRLEG